MFEKISFQDWEALVKKQLKTDDIYAFLNKENLEGITIKPYCDLVERPISNLPKIEKSTHLVAHYEDSLEDDVFAFLIQENIKNVKDKTFFIQTEKTFSEIQFLDNNNYLSLIDVFDEKKGEINEDLAQKLIRLPLQRNIAIDVALHQNAGASIVQQLAIALAKTRDLIAHFGTEILDKIVFKFAIGANYFFEISKIRAFKMLFNQLSKEYGLNKIPYIFAETSLRNKSIHDEENNLIRSTLELAGAMIAGADAVFSNDYKLTKNTTLSQEISFKQQIVLAYESIINVFEDATNGSYYVVEITQQLAEKSWQYFLEIEEDGGYLENLKNGKIQKAIYQQATMEQTWVQEGKIKLIGVNLYPSLPIQKEITDLYNKQEIKPVRWSEMFE